jgi:hypothetical protein
MTDTAKLIDAVIQAPTERRDAILAAARGTDKPRPGTVRQAAEIMNTCPRTIERYARQGLFKAIRISPRRVRYDLNEVERLATRGIGGG